MKEDPEAVSRVLELELRRQNARLSEGRSELVRNGSDPTVDVNKSDEAALSELENSFPLNILGMGGSRRKGPSGERYSQVPAPPEVGV